MPRQIIEYRCLLISPGDVTEERDALTKLVNDWNAQVGNGLGARVDLVRWESHATPDMAGPPLGCTPMEESIRLSVAAIVLKGVRLRPHPFMSHSSLKLWSESRHKSGVAINMDSAVADSRPHAFDRGWCSAKLHRRYYRDWYSPGARRLLLIIGEST